MDKEITDKMMRITGNIEAISEAAKRLTCMPNDKRTADNLEVARVALNKAVLSAWEYANNARGEHG